MYLLRDEEEGAGETTEGNSNQSPPTYKMTDIAPPAYTDALQDVLVSQQTSKEVQQDADQRDLVEVSLEENEVRRSCVMEILNSTLLFTLHCLTHLG